MFDPSSVPPPIRSSSLGYDGDYAENVRTQFHSLRHTLQYAAL
jgi:hypothetical protein